jgi:PAS domain S-box-containing protein
VFIAMTAVVLYFERKHADETLKKNEERFRIMADFTYDWEYWVGPDGRFIYVSPSVDRITGYRADEFMTDPQLTQRIIHPDDDNIVSKHITNEPKKGETASIEFRIITRNGEERWLGHVCQQVYDKQGNLLGIRASNRDITERKHAEELERMQLEKMAHADKMITLGTLVSGVAHEINNPTNFITLNTPILQESWQGTRPILDEYYHKEGDFAVGRFPYSALRERMDQLLEGVAEGAERITRIVASLKDFARPDPSDMHQEVDINRVIHNALTLLKSPIEKHTRHFSVSYDESIPTILGSSQKLEQVMINLIQNALEALAEETKAVSVSSRYEKKQHTIVIEVKDEGDGIAEEILSQILDPFFTTKRTSGGTGLGLPIVARIVKDHSGELTFSSELGKGTTAEIILPVKEKK